MQIPEDDEIARQRFALFRIFSFTGILACIGTAVKMYSTIENSGLLPFFIWGLSIVLLINFYGVKKVSGLRNAYLLMLVAAFALLHLVSYSCGGIRTGGTFYFTIVILYSFMLLGSRAGQWFTGFAIAHIIYLYFISSYTTWTSFDFFKNDIGFINQDFLINAILTFLLIASQSIYLQSSKNAVIQGLVRSKNSLEEKNRQLTEKNQLLKNYAASLEKSNRELDKFASVASHDLKAPLRAIGALAGMIEEDSGEQLRGESRQHFKTIVGRVSRMEQLIDALLEYSKADRRMSKMEYVDTLMLAEELRHLLCTRPGIKLNISSLMPVIFYDRNRIRLIFSHLISNAIIHNSQSTIEMELCCKWNEVYWIFSLKDNGPGIEKAYHDKIFVIFQTLARRDSHETTGAGLAITKKLVEESGGEIWVESVPGKGAEFFFTIPKANEKQVNATADRGYA
jgi:signal transduction histidine kinase